jgi:hypothetical protein
MRHNQWKFGQIGAVTKGTLLLRPNSFCPYLTNSSLPLMVYTHKKNTEVQNMTNMTASKTDVCRADVEVQMTLVLNAGPAYCPCVTLVHVMFTNHSPENHIFDFCIMHHTHISITARLLKSKAYGAAVHLRLV